MAKNNGFNIYEEIANMRATKLFKNALRRYVEGKKINNKTEFNKILAEFKNNTVEVK